MSVYQVELFRTRGGKQLAYIVHQGERIAVSKTPVTGEEAIQLLREQGLDGFISIAANNHKQKAEEQC